VPHYYLRTLAPNKAAASFSSCSSCSSPSAPRNSSAPCNCCAARRTLPAPLSSVLRRTLPTPRSQSSESSRSLCANTPGRRCGAGAGAGAGLGQRVRALGVLLHRLRARAPRRARELQVARGRRGELQPDLDRCRGPPHARGGWRRRGPRRVALARCARGGDFRVWTGRPAPFRKREGAFFSALLLLAVGGESHHHAGLCISSVVLHTKQSRATRE
jgi:hypothetical protein